jgi:hypothetical protein
VADVVGPVCVCLYHQRHEINHILCKSDRDSICSRILQPVRAGFDYHG